MKRYDFNSGWTCRPLSREGEAVPVTVKVTGPKTLGRADFQDI